MGNISAILDDSKVYEFVKKELMRNYFEFESCGISFIKFVFEKDDIQFIKEKIDMSNDKYRYTIKALEKNVFEYENRDSDMNADDIFIKVDDSYRFFKLLYRIYNSVNVDNNLTPNKALIKSIWLRMNVHDIDNVNGFLEKQLNFLYGDRLFGGKHRNFETYGDYKLVYDDCFNGDSFETNNHIKMSLVNKDYEGAIKNAEEKYDFPVVHYAIDYENGMPVCYIYGIQALYVSEARKDEKIKEYLKQFKKPLRNGSVSSEFILALKLFTDIIQTYGVTDIRVPLLQVFNYPYHEFLSTSCNSVFDTYTENQKKDYDKIIDETLKPESLNAFILEYLFTKESYNRFYNKQDIISKNKTERLIDTFILMQEKYGNIEIINEPFIEGDTLLIKIKNEAIKEKKKEK